MTRMRQGHPVMVPVFKLTWPLPVVHLESDVNVYQAERVPVQPSGTRSASKTKCGAAQVAVLYRDADGKPGHYYENASWMLWQHATAMKAHLCKRCFPEWLCRCYKCYGWDYRGDHPYPPYKLRPTG